MINWILGISMGLLILGWIVAMWGDNSQPKDQRGRWG